jgi:hypothetical protein
MDDQEGGGAVTWCNNSGQFRGREYKHNDTDAPLNYWQSSTGGLCPRLGPHQNMTRELGRRLEYRTENARAKAIYFGLS